MSPRSKDKNDIHDILKQTVQSINENVSYDADEDMLSEEEDVDDDTEALKKYNSLDDIIKMEPNAIEMKLKSLAPSISKSVRKTKINKIKINRSHSDILIDENKKFKKRTYVQSRLWLLRFFLNGIVGSFLNIAA